MTEPPVVRTGISINAPRERVFDALVDATQIPRWFQVTAAETDPRPGGRWRLTYAPGRCSSGTFAVVDRPHRIVMRWNEWHEDDAGTPLPDQDTSVISTSVVRLQPEGVGTRIDVVQDGYPDTPHWHAFAERLTEGWDIELAGLRRWLEDGLPRAGQGA